MGGACQPLGAGAMSFARPALLPLALLLPLAVAVLVAAWANRRATVARARSQWNSRCASG